MPDSRIAYFSMEIALEPGIPTYSGGLGVLAGDTIRSAADLGLPLIAVSLLYRKGYFRQHLAADGTQTAEPQTWDVAKSLAERPERVSVTIEGRTVYLRAWQYTLTGGSGRPVEVFLLDSDLPENAEADRALTHTLYGGDPRYRLCQEVILGIGGIRMLRALGHASLDRYHMNEGHAALLTLALLDERAQAAGRPGFAPEDVDWVRQRCVFTTHTPVPAGHDQFPLELAGQVLGRSDLPAILQMLQADGTLNMTRLCLALSRYVNGVAKKHGEISRHMFPNHKIDSITNGVHAVRWTAPPLQELFTRRLPGWKEDPTALRGALGLAGEELWGAHMAAKQALFDHVKHSTGTALPPEVLTVGFARRFAAYKRASLLFHDLERLKRIAGGARKIQFLYAGKAHPHDEAGHALIKSLYQSRQGLGGAVQVVILEDYGMALGGLMTAGVDVWLNTPNPPLEASGTSGMKAALNGVPSLSTLDGWWIEGHVEGVTGWSIGEPGGNGASHEDRTPADAASLYDKLEHAVVPLYYQHRDGFLNVMRHAIALNGAHFNTQRMVQDYVLKAYFP